MTLVLPKVLRNATHRLSAMFVQPHVRMLMYVPMLGSCYYADPNIDALFLHLLLASYPMFDFDETMFCACILQFSFVHGWRCSIRANHTPAKSRDHEIVRAERKVSKGRPETLPKSCSVITHPRCGVKSYVTRDPQPNVISMNFHSCGPHT